MADDWETVREGEATAACRDRQADAPVADRLERIPVPGGWLYRTQTAAGVALAYVPGGAGALTVYHPKPID
jgi:hypothetical protein